MKIIYKTVLEIDEKKFSNLSKKYIREQIKLTLDSIIAAMENEGIELQYLIDENREKQNYNRQ